MRIFARLLGILFLVLALVILAADLAAAARGEGAGELRPLGALWYAADPGSLNLVQAVIERYVWEPLWDPVLIGLLQVPGVYLFAGLGLILIALGFLPARKPKTPPPPKSPKPPAKAPKKKQPPIKVLKTLSTKKSKKPAPRVEPHMGS